MYPFNALITARHENMLHTTASTLHLDGTLKDCKIPAQRGSLGGEKEGAGYAEEHLS